MANHVAPLAASPSLDIDYRFGRPKVYLAPRELARLIALRSRLGDTRAEREAEYLIPHPAGAASLARPE
jgi:hypothetical protein